MANNVNKYLIFNINDEDYAIPISKVRTVIRYVKITPIHESSEFIMGVINLRGKIIPIVNMRKKFGLTEKKFNDRTVFIIVDILGAKEVYNIGITVDAVQDVMDISAENMERTPDIGLRLKSQYLEGIAKVENKMIMILNMDRILTSEEVVSLQDTGVETQEAVAAE